ncbi:MAG: ChbG/HpnK family deacetylase [Fimbriimonadaceae bacterium]
MPERKIVLRMDDAGSCESANRAVRECADAGIAKNASLMVPGPAFEHAARLLAGHPNLCFGLHVVLNAEWDTVKWGPVAGPCRVPSLCEATGMFTSEPKVLHNRGFSLDEAELEVRAQLAKAREAGFAIRYMDEHMGVGWLGGLAERLARIAADEGLVFRPKLEYPALETALDPGSGPEEQAEARVRALIDGLARAGEGPFLYVTHPGLDEPDMRSFVHAGLVPGAVARERDLDRRMFVSPLLREGLDRLGIRSIRYDEIGA